MDSFTHEYVKTSRFYWPLQHLFSPLSGSLFQKSVNRIVERFTWFLVDLQHFCKIRCVKQFNLKFQHNSHHFFHVWLYRANVLRLFWFDLPFAMFPINSLLFLSIFLTWRLNHSGNKKLNKYYSIIDNSSTCTYVLMIGDFNFVKCGYRFKSWVTTLLNSKAVGL